MERNKLIMAMAVALAGFSWTVFAQVVTPAAPAKSVSKAKPAKAKASEAKTVEAAKAAEPAKPAGFIQDGAALVKAADWNKMETVTVELGEYHFHPMDLKLKAGQPYKIELKNVGEKHHYYTAPEFFKNVAWRKLMVNGQAEIKVDYVNALEVLKKPGQLDIYIIPVNKGTYTVYCTIDDHREKGMEGTIIVE